MTEDVANGARASLLDRARPLDRRQFVVGSLVTAISVAMPMEVLAAPTKWGYFNGDIVAKWLDDGRTMRLTEPFEYVGPDGRKWPVPTGTVVDGASIPQSFWSVIGGPFEGMYRKPSVVHDYYCGARTRKFQCAPMLP